MTEWAESIKQIWINRKLEEHRAYREGRLAQKIQSLPGYQSLNLRNAETRIGIPQSILDAHDFYCLKVETEDYGSVFVFKEIIQNRDVFVVEVGTEGSRGWLELFDECGQSLGSAITAAERLAWREIDIIRASYTQNSKLPAELTTRRTRNDCFSSEQETRISTCFDKWKKICFSTEIIDDGIAADAIKAAYHISGITVEPEIHFINSPYAALTSIIGEVANDMKLSTDRRMEGGDQIDLKLESSFNSQQSAQILQNLVSHLEEQVYAQIDTQLKKDLFMALYDSLWVEQSDLVIKILESHITKEIWNGSKENGSWAYIFRIVRKQLRRSIIRHEYLCMQAASLEAYISILGYDCDLNRWSILESLASSCGWIIPTEKSLIACGRPIKFSFDLEGNLHADEGAAMKFADGFSVYSEHGNIQRIITNEI
jgi:hypothetical protein